jgi:3-oxoacyl-[acyl-carrier-protein] synthase-1
VNTTALDPRLQSRIILKGAYQPLQRVITNSFGFGGNNCSLIFGKAM